ncbi:MAG: EamA family transporter [Candidatus Moranbacteria bacterium]|nr:EamA family transporter [Candidatus Moranbacteria bacterium]
MEPWIIYALLAALFASLVAIFGKIGLEGIDTTLATTIRAIVMAGVLTTAAIALGKTKLLDTISTNALIWIVLSATAGAISWFFYFLALKSGPTTGVAALDRLSVVFVLVLAALFLSEGITWKTGMGATLMTIGALFFVFK